MNTKKLYENMLAMFPRPKAHGTIVRVTVADVTFDLTWEQADGFLDMMFAGTDTLIKEWMTAIQEARDNAKKRS